MVHLGFLKKNLRLLPPALLFAIAPAGAQENATRDWSGIWIGLGGGVSSTNYANRLTGTRLCFAQTTGGGSAGCSIGHASVSAEAHAERSGASATSTASAAAGAENGYVGRLASPDADPPTVESNLAWTSFDAPGSVGGGVGLASVDLSAFSMSAVYADAPESRFFAYSEARAADALGRSDSLAVGLLNIFDLAAPDFSANARLAAGGHVRYDHQFANDIILGAEAEISFSPDGVASLHDEATAMAGSFGPFDLKQSASVESDFTAGLKLRIGRAHGDFLAYATGGIGFGAFEASVDRSLSASGGKTTIRDSQSASRLAIGPVIGGGVSMWLGERTVLSGEALYYSFDDEIRFGPTDAVELDGILSVSAKLSFRLN